MEQSELFKNLTDEFGKRLGVKNLAPGKSGNVDMIFGKLGRLQLEESGENVFVTLARRFPQPRENSAATLLRLCHWESNHPWEMHPGAIGDDLLTVTARVAAREIDVPVLERIIPLLANILDKVEEAG